MREMPAEAVEAQSSAVSFGNHVTVNGKVEVTQNIGCAVYNSSGSDQERSSQDGSIKETRVGLNHSCTELPAENPDFVGREGSLSQLSEQLAAGPSAITHRLTVQGLGGVGKTALALAFAYQHQANYTFIRWLNAGLQDTLEERPPIAGSGSSPSVSAETANVALGQSFRELATALGIDLRSCPSTMPLMKAVYAKLREIPTWLLIFDNAKDYGAIRPYLPERLEAGQHILITSRNPDWKQTVELDVFQRSESQAYIQAKLPGTSASDCAALHEALGGLPLALAHAVAYIKQDKLGKMTVPQYLRLLDEVGVKLLGRPLRGEAAYTIRETVLTTWQLSMEWIEKSYPLAREVLAMSGYLAPDGIPRTLVEHAVKLPAQADSTSSLNQAAFTAALTQLYVYALVQPGDQPDHFNVHRLVQSVVRERDQARPEVKVLEHRLKPLVEEINALDVEGARDQFSAVAKAKQVHALALLEPLEQVVSSAEGRRAEWLLGRCLFQAGVASWHLGDARQAKGLYERVLKIEIARYGFDHPEVAATFASVGIATGQLGDAAGAKAIFEQALKIQVAHYGSDHPQVARTLVNLGLATSQLGNAAGAKLLYEQALKIQVARYGSDHPQVAPTLVNLGSATQELGDAASAKALYERALKLQEARVGPDHPEVAATLGNLGNAIRELGDAAGAKALHERALKIKETHYGPDHPEVATTLGNLGNATRELGDAAGAKALYERALEIMEAYYESDHPEVAKALANLGNATLELGDAVGAKALYERALKIDEAHYGPDHPKVAATLVNLGIATGQLGDAAGAKALYERALKIDEAHYGPDHPKVAATLVNLGIATGQLGDAAGAKALYERALKIHEAHVGPDHPQVVKTIENLGSATRQLGDAAGAKALYERALKLQEACCGPDHPQLAGTLVDLGNATFELGDPAGAKALYERALKIKETHCGPDHPEVAARLVNLGAAISVLGDAAGAKALYERALKVQEAHYGPGHPEVAGTLENLGTVSSDLGDVAGAKTLFERALKIEEAHYGPNHPEVAATLGNLGNATRVLGDTAGAKTLYERALKIQTQYYPPYHPEIASRLFQLGLLLFLLGKQAIGSACVARAYRDIACYPGYGPQHPLARMAKSAIRSCLPNLAAWLFSPARADLSRNNPDYHLNLFFSGVSYESAPDTASNGEEDAAYFSTHT